MLICQVPHLKVSLQTQDTRFDVAYGFLQSLKFTAGLAPLHITTSAISFPFLHSGLPCALIAMANQCFRLALPLPTCTCRFQLAGSTASESQSRSHFFQIWCFLFPTEQIGRMLFQIIFPSVLFVIPNGHRRHIPTVTGNNRRNSI